LEPLPDRIRILHLITDLDVGGAELVLARLVESADASRFAHTVVSLSDRGAVGARIAAAGIPVHELRMRKGASNVSALWRLFAVVRQLRPAVIQTWLYHADLAGAIVTLLGSRVPLVWNIRCAELDPRDHPRSLGVVLRILAAWSARPAAVICNSTAGRTAHQRLGYRPRAWELIPNGFDTEVLRPSAAARSEIRAELGVASDTPLVGLLARVHPMKDHETFLSAAAAVAAARPDVQFVIAGRGTEAAATLHERARVSGIAARVHFLGERDDAPRLLAALDVAVSSSYGEAFPNAVGEAMACGTPCVVTDVGDTAALVGDTGIVVPPRDPAALARGIEHVLNLPATERQALGCAARRRVADNFSLARTTERYERLYLQVAGC
jgi:glycosyltransferase involved in cell wall biosynthesis